MVIWKDVSVPVVMKEYHITKIGKRVHFSFILTVGDVPICNFNEITGQVEAVVNTRGYAYAARKRKCYRPKKNNNVNF
jgi:hypothetical protein